MRFRKLIIRLILSPMPYSMKRTVINNFNNTWILLDTDCYE
jgi:hypothetical protein